MVLNAATMQSKESPPRSYHAGIDRNDAGEEILTISVNSRIDDILETYGWLLACTRKLLEKMLLARVSEMGFQNDPEAVEELLDKWLLLAEAKGIMNEPMTTEELLRTLIEVSERRENG